MTKRIKKLPIEIPPITAFSHQIFPMAILMENKESLDWIYSNYIQIFALTDLYNRGVRSGTGDFFFRYDGCWQELEVRACPWIEYSMVPYKLLFSHYDVHDFITASIDAECYVKVCIDIFYIKNYASENHVNHEILIYGYDKEKEIYYAADNFAHGKFGWSEVEFSDMKQALSSVIEADFATEGFQEYAILMKYRKCQNSIDEMFELNIHKIIYELKSYLLMNGYGEEYRMNSKECVFGMDYYKELDIYLKKCQDSLEKVDIRTISTLIDHKIMMAFRIKYLSEKGYLRDCEIDEEVFLIFYKQLIQARNFILKYNITRVSRSIEKAVILLEAVSISEKQAIIKLIEGLENDIKNDSVTTT